MPVHLSAHLTMEQYLQYQIHREGRPYTREGGGGEREREREREREIHEKLEVYYILSRLGDAFVVRYILFGICPCPVSVEFIGAYQSCHVA